MKKDFKAHDFYNFQSLAEPQLCPHNQKLIYLQRKVDNTKQKYLSAIYLKAENKTVQLTEYEQNAKSARWSPSGEYISYTFNKLDQNYLAVYNLKTKATNTFSTELNITSPPIWCKNSKMLVFTAIKKNVGDINSYLGAPKKTNDELTNSMINVVTDIDYKFDGQGYFSTAKNGIYIATLNDNKEINGIEKIGLFNCNYSHPIFSQQSNYIYAVKQVKDKDNLFFEYELIMLNVETNEEQVIVKNKGQISQLQLSPNGNEIAFIAVGSDEQYYDSRLYICNINQRNTTVEQLIEVSKGLSRNIGEQPASDVRFSSQTPKYQWLSNSNGFTILYVNKGSSVLAELSRDCNVKILYYDDTKSISAFSRVNEKIVLLLGDCENPESIYEYNNNQLTELVNSNKWLQQYNIGKTTKFVYNGAENELIDGWYILPSNHTDKKMPTILMIHGGPQGIYGSSFMFLAQLYVSMGYAVLYTNPRGSLSYGIDFALKVINDWGNRDYIDIMRGLQYLIDLGIADVNKLGVTGYSYGGYMTNLITTKSNRFKAAVAGGSVVNLYSMYGTCDKGHSFIERQLNATPWSNGIKLLFHSPINYVDKINTPLLLIHGEGDLRCPISQSEELFAALKRQNKNIVLVRYKDQYHLITNPALRVDYFCRGVAWMNEYIK